MDWYSETLESKYAMQILLYIRENPGMSKSDVMRFSDSGNERTKYTRISNLIDDGLIKVEKGGNQWNTARLYLTPKGQEVGALIEKINNIMCSLKKNDEPQD